MAASGNGNIPTSSRQHTHIARTVITRANSSAIYMYRATAHQRATQFKNSSQDHDAAVELVWGCFRPALADRDGLLANLDAVALATVVRRRATPGSSCRINRTLSDSAGLCRSVRLLSACEYLLSSL